MLHDFVQPSAFVLPIARDAEPVAHVSPYRAIDLAKPRTKATSAEWDRKEELACIVTVGDLKQWYRNGWSIDRMLTMHRAESAAFEPMTIERLADMNDAQFEAFSERNPALVRALMGG